MTSIYSYSPSPLYTMLRQLLLFCTATLILSLATSRQSFSQITITEINPNQSSLHNSDPDGASGGRVNGLANVVGNNRTFYAATEWGGLYKSMDGGRNWVRLNNHLPTATWDVEVSPTDANRVYATSFYDGRAASFAGINISTDGGNTWIHPQSATPPAGFCNGEERRDEPSAFGISIDPANPQNIYIGTNCGLAISTDGGNNWRYVDPTPDDLAEDVWDVVAHHAGIIDLCGDDEHRRSTDRGASWSTATGRALLSGRCSITASPDEAHVLFAVVGTFIFESDDGGRSWATQFTNPSSQGRVPFVATNQRTGRAFDLWFGDTSLHRASCMTPAAPAPGGSPRCPASNSWAGGFTRSAGGHDDTGDIVFDTQATDDSCPRLYASDGGVYINSRTTNPTCHTPAWRQPDATTHSLWLFGMSGANRPGADDEDLYFGAQDNGTFAVTNAGANPPTWFNRDCCDSFDISSDSNRVVYTSCCFSADRGNRLFLSDPGMTGPVQINKYPPGDLDGFRSLDIIDQFGPDDYVLVTASGVFVTLDITANPVSWRQLGASTSPPNACGVRVSGSSANPTFYVQAGFCSGRHEDRLWKYTGTGISSTWQRVPPPGGTGGFGIYDVHPTDPNRLFASHLTEDRVQMVLSTDGGSLWVNNAALDNLMSGAGTYRSFNRLGPTDFTEFGGYPQPSLVAFDPDDQDTLLAGGADSGLFLSTDRGANWTVITNNSGNAANPHIPRPRFAYFDHENGLVNVYIGTQGRGIWKLSYQE
jgi:photosystem II stability/assembly factor-like uncharacterized protein